MRTVSIILVALVGRGQAVHAHFGLVGREQAVLPAYDDATGSGAIAAAASDDIHQPFTNVLSSVRATLTNVTQDVETVEQSGPGSGPASQLREHTESALREIEQVLGLPRSCIIQPPPLLPQPPPSSQCPLWSVMLSRGLRAYGMCGAALRLPRGCHRL